MGRYVKSALRSNPEISVVARILRGHDFSRAEPALVPAEEPATKPGHGVLASAALHSLVWLSAANLIGVWLAVLLLFPNAGRWLGSWSYGRWTPVHLNFQLYGWMALPLVGWAMRMYRADRGSIVTWSRAALVLWSLALGIGALSWLSGNTSGKLFLDWTGFARIFFPLAILFLWCTLAAGYKQSWGAPDNLSIGVRAAKLIGLVLLLLVPGVLYIASSPTIYPAVNPDTGGPTGASQLESTLVIVLILLLLPYGLARRKASGRVWIGTAWIVVGLEALLCLALGRADVSHHRPAQFLSLGSLLVWVPLVPVYFESFEWPRKHAALAVGHADVVGRACAYGMGIFSSQHPRPLEIHRRAGRSLDPGHGRIRVQPAAAHPRGAPWEGWGCSQWPARFLAVARGYFRVCCSVSLYGMERGV